jgi:hypothetical protein
MGGDRGNRMEIVEAVINAEEVQESISMLRTILAANLR